MAKVADERPRSLHWKPRGPSAGVAASPGLYVHVPFCSAICPYCDFAVVRAREGEPARFVEVLLREARSWGERIDPGTVPAFDTVYFGGGTPSALTARDLEAVVQGLQRFLPIAESAEWSLEANPEDVSATSLQRWRSLGFTVVSLGVQALDDVVLKDLGRRHDARGARAAIDSALRAGYDRVSCDLIYATGKRTLDQWRRELQEISRFGLEHLSCYELTFHEGTPYERQRLLGKRSSLEEQERARWFLTTHRELAALGLDGYEVSNFARSEGSRARHNQKYWNYQPYLGLGPSAHSFDGGRRWWNVRSPRSWLGSADTFVAGCEELTQADRLLEQIHLSLRTREGIDLERFTADFGVDLVVDAVSIVESEIERGRLEHIGRWLRPTLEGWLVCDALTVALAEAVGTS